jgi:hypothetical protein
MICRIGALIHQSDNTVLIPAAALMAIRNIASILIRSIGVTNTGDAISTAIEPIAERVFIEHLLYFAHRFEAELSANLLVNLACLKCGRSRLLTMNPADTGLVACCE